MAKLFIHDYPSGIVLASTTENPAVIAVTATVEGVIGVHGLSQKGQPDYNFSWSVINLGSIAAAGTASSGIILEAGGAVVNDRFISGGRYGIQINRAGTVANNGTVIAGGTGGIGVDLAGGGSVTNGRSGALIQSSGEGVSIAGAAATLTNEGTVKSTGVGLFYGVLLSAAGSNVLNNGATGYIGSFIGEGAKITGGAATVTNSGTIRALRMDSGGKVTNGVSGSATGNIGFVLADNAAAAVSNYGSLGQIELFAGGTVTNAQSAARIETASFSSGVEIYGAPGRVTNLGTIDASGREVISGVDIAAGGTVVNGALGTSVALIQSGSSFGQNGVEISAAPFSPFASPGPGTVVNYGSIIGGDGIVLAAGGSVINAQSGAQIVGQHYAGVNISGGAGTVTNLGTIESTGPGNMGEPTIGNAGIEVSAGGTIVNGSRTDTNASIYSPFFGIAGARSPVAGTPAASTAITNFGRIIGDQRAAIEFFDTANDTVENAGTIESFGGTAVAFGAGNDRLIVDPGAKFFGVVTGGGGIDEADFNQAGTIDGAEYLGFSTFDLGNGGAQKLTLSEAGFTGLKDSTITVVAGDGANTVDASAFSPLHILSYTGASGKDAVTGGSGNDAFFFSAAALAAGDRVAGGPGSDLLVITTAGIPAIGGVTGIETVQLAPDGADTLVLRDANFTATAGTISVIGGPAGNRVDAAAVSAPNRIVFTGGAGADTAAGGAGDDVFRFTAAALGAADTVAGGAGNDRLVLTSSGTIGLTGVTGIETYRLASTGANTLTLSNARFALVEGHAVTVIGGSKGNTINGAALAGFDRLTVDGGAGTDLISGGAGGDSFVFSAGALSSADHVAGNGGSDELDMTSSGTVRAAHVTGIETYVLGDTGNNVLTLGNANFAGVVGRQITVVGGDRGNTVNAAAATSADAVVVFAGIGADTITGGAGNDRIHAGGKTNMTGGGGADQFIFTGIGNNTVADFRPGSDRLVLSNAGFDLGVDDGNGTTAPQRLDAGVFLAAGKATAPGQRFLYSKATGNLSYDRDGNGPAASVLVAHLTGAPTISAGDLFYIA